jgi:hypothetical protein
VGSIYGKAIAADDIGLTGPIDPTVKFDSRDSLGTHETNQHDFWPGGDPTVVEKSRKKAFSPPRQPIFRGFCAPPGGSRFSPPLNLNHPQGLKNNATGSKAGAERSFWKLSHYTMENGSPFPFDENLR